MVRIPFEAAERVAGETENGNTAQHIALLRLFFDPSVINHHIPILAAPVTTVLFEPLM